MDIATIIGFLVMNIMVFGSMATTSIGIGGYIDIPSILIVVGGTLGAVFISFPMAEIKTAVPVFMKIIKPGSDNQVELINTIVGLAEQARKEGILALEGALTNVENQFLKSGLQLTIDGTEAELVQDILNAEINFINERHKIAIGGYSTVASLAPAFGMIGTLVGLVAMLANMSDPSSIGPSMSVALITTLYGSMIANMYTVPVANKLSYYAGIEVATKEMIVQGIISIQAGDNPRIVQRKLKSFLSPTAQALIKEK